MNKIDKNSNIRKNLQVMDTPSNQDQSGMPGIPGLSQGGVVKTFEDPNQKNKNSHKCTVINDQISKQLNVREQVFRNPNMPTLTLDEFADREMARMEEATANQNEAQANKTDSDSEDEEVANKKTYKAREWDDWKDLNDKGSGNKMG